MVVLFSSNRCFSQVTRVHGTLTIWASIWAPYTCVLGCINLLKAGMLSIGHLGTDTSRHRQQRHLSWTMLHTKLHSSFSTMMEAWCGRIRFTLAIMDIKLGSITAAPTIGFKMQERHQRKAPQWWVGMDVLFLRGHVWLATVKWTTSKWSSFNFYVFSCLLLQS